MNSLSCKEDRRFLKGETKFMAVMKYLTQKYDRPSELVSHVLATGANLPAAQDDTMMKNNILTVLGIKRDLQKYKMVQRIDSYYISSVRVLVLTTAEMKRYVREKNLFDETNKIKVTLIAVLGHRTLVG